jgi:hypothetical protein
MSEKLIKLCDESEEWEYLEWCTIFPERKPSKNAKTKAQIAQELYQWREYATQQEKTIATLKSEIYILRNIGATNV